MAKITKTISGGGQSSASKVTKVIGGGPQSKVPTNFTPAPNISTPSGIGSADSSGGITYYPSRGGGSSRGSSRSAELARQAAARRAEEERKRKGEEQRQATLSALADKEARKAEAERLAVEMASRRSQQGFIRSTTDRFGNVTTRDIRTGDVVAYKSVSGIKQGTRTENVITRTGLGPGGFVIRSSKETKTDAPVLLDNVGTDIIFDDEGTTFKQKATTNKEQKKERKNLLEEKPKAEIRAFEGPYEISSANKPVNFRATLGDIMEVIPNWSFFKSTSFGKKADDKLSNIEVGPTLTGFKDEGFSTPRFGQEALTKSVRTPDKRDPLSEMSFTPSGEKARVSEGIGAIGITVANLPRFVEGAFKDPIGTGKGTINYFKNLPARLTSPDPRVQGTASGELLASYAIGKGVSKGAAKANPVKLGDVSFPVKRTGKAGAKEPGVQGYKTIEIKVGARERGPILLRTETGRGIINLVKTVRPGSPKKVDFKIEPLDRGYEPVGSATGRKIFESTEGLKGSGLDPKSVQKIRLGIEASDLVGKGTNTLIKKKFLTSLSNTLTPKEIGALFEVLKPYKKKLTIKGSSGQQSQVYDQFKREFGDIDFDVSGPKSLSTELASKGAKAISEAEGRKFEAVGTDIKGPDGKSVQFLSKADEPGGYGVAQSRGFGGFKYDLKGVQNILIEEAKTKFKTTTRTGQIRRKAASVFTIQGPKSRPTFGGEAGKGLNVGPPGFPKGGRTKDVADLPRLLLTEAGELQKSRNPLTVSRGRELEATTKNIMKEFPEVDFAKEFSKGGVELPFEDIVSAYDSPRASSASAFQVSPASLGVVPSRSASAVSPYSSSIKIKTRSSPSSPRSSSPRSPSSVISISSIGSPSLVSAGSPRGPARVPGSSFSIGSPGTPNSLGSVGSPGSPDSPKTPGSPGGPGYPRVPTEIVVGSPFGFDSPRGSRKKKGARRKSVPRRGFQYTATLLGLAREKTTKETRGPLYDLGVQGKKLSFTGVEARLPTKGFLTGLGGANLLFAGFGKRRKK